MGGGSGAPPGGAKPPGGGASEVGRSASYIGGGGRGSRSEGGCAVLRARRCGPGAGTSGGGDSTTAVLAGAGLGAMFCGFCSAAGLDSAALGFASGALGLASGGLAVRVSG